MLKKRIMDGPSRNILLALALFLSFPEPKTEEVKIYNYLCDVTCTVAHKNETVLPERVTT